MTKRPRPDRLPWEDDMTLCIAAAARENRESRIVLAADFRGETGWTSADVVLKLSWLTGMWPALFAGNVASARAVLNTYVRSLDGVELTDSNLDEELRRPAQNHKRALCEHYVQMKLGISYLDFIQFGKGSLSKSAFQETELEIQNLNLDCDLIACGFPPSKYESRHKTSRIFTIAASGDVCERDNFAAIGTGSVIAHSVLYQRNLTGDAPLERAVYVVYEALKLAINRAPGVGKLVNIVVIQPSTDEGFIEARFLKLEGFEHQEELFKVYGPKTLVDILPKVGDDWFASDFVRKVSMNS